MSTTTFTTSIQPLHSFEEEELKRLRKQFTLPHFAEKEDATKPRPFDLEKLLKAYLNSMPTKKDSWYDYTDWRHYDWTKKPKEMSYEEAHFCFRALMHAERYTEHKNMNYTSDKVLAEQDYTERLSAKQITDHIIAQKKRLTQLIGPQSHFDLLAQNGSVFDMIAVMLPREAHIPFAHTMIEKKLVEGYSMYNIYSLFPVPRDQEELDGFAPQARALINALDLTQSSAARAAWILATRYDLSEEFSSLVESAQSHKHDLDYDLFKMYYGISEEAQADFRKFYRSALTGHHLKIEFALNAWENLATWFEIGIARKGDLWFGEAQHLHTPDAVKFFATLAGSGGYRRLAERWLMTQGANAIAGLIPLLSHRGHVRDVATAVLRRYKRQGHGELIASVADALEDDAGKSQLQELVLDWEYQQKPYFDAKDTPAWLGTITASQSKLPKWLEDEEFPVILTDDGEHQLTEEQVKQIVVTLRDQGDSRTHSDKVLLMRKHLSRRDLGALSWTIFDAWLKDGASTKEKWAYLAVGHVGTALEGQKIAPYLKIWPKQNKWRMAQEVLEIYRMIGSDGALMTLNGVAQKVRQKSVRSRAEALLNSIAKARNLTPSQLEDRIIPDCDLDAMGRYTFDYGTREFTLAFDSELKPVLRDEKRSKIVKSLPKPGKTDDEEMAEEARETFKIMKKQIKEVISVQLPRLEAAMITGRTWTGEEIRSLLIEHPLMTHFARRLLWGVIDKRKQIIACFRVDEDNNVLDAEDEPFALYDDAQVIIAHPLELSHEQLETWGTVFGDYEIIPPFPQLNRPVYGLEPGEEGQYELKRFAKLPIPGLSLKGFVEKSTLWRRGMAEDAGIVNVFYAHFDHQKVSCVVDMEVGFDVGGGGWSENGGLSAVTFYRGSGRTYSYGANKSTDGYKLEEVPKMVLSEVLYSLYKFTSKYE